MSFRNTGNIGSTSNHVDIANNDQAAHLSQNANTTVATARHHQRAKKLTEQAATIDNPDEWLRLLREALESEIQARTQGLTTFSGSFLERESLFAVDDSSALRASSAKPPLRCDGASEANEGDLNVEARGGSAVGSMSDVDQMLTDSTSRELAHTVESGEDAVEACDHGMAPYEAQESLSLETESVDAKSSHGKESSFDSTSDDISVPAENPS
ncbi:hypothetical protein LTR37_008617 [Vermiconidia calcicola]|uniref:Uncharacterized protein n=1 Tax=Vermiconidia calcicola TaxID=1690605 RepID=A0ACC3NBP4_9PEZI|nr:hypothetical protein LTR37_008617 [Vermiconidia calcicola]